MGQLVFQAALGGAVNLIGPNISATTNFTLPGADGTNGQALTTNGSGVLGFSSIVSGAAGSNTQIQFNNGGNFGASSNLTWNGTTFSTTGLSASGSVTLSGGTANGVTYLNGSKVLTSGSALVFDGTNLGVGISNPSSYQGNADNLVVGNLIDAGTGITIVSGTASLGSIHFADSPTGDDSYRGFIQYDHTSNYLRFATNAAERLRITSAGSFGFGTTTPDVFSRGYSGTTVGISSASGETALMINSSGTNVVAFEMGRGGSRSTLLYDTTTSTDFGTLTSKPLRFLTNGTTVATLDSAGNLGLGVTPSAWWSGVKALQFGTAGVLWSNSDRANFASNVYIDSGTAPRYINDGYALRYAQETGTHAWSIAASGTAGNAISFTQAMTLDASGNLGVGVTSPSQKLELAGVLRVKNGNADTNGLNFSSDVNGIGYINAGYASVGQIVFQTAGTERARIDSSGNLLVHASGTDPYSTSGGYGIALNGSADYIAVARSGGAAIYAARQGSNGALSEWWCQGNSVGSISVTTTLTSYNVTSDYRLKNTIAPMTGALAKVALLKPVTYKWNFDGSNCEGFIAHELAEVCPLAVTGEKDAVDADGKPVHQGIDVSFLVATLTAAIQEQQAIIESLKARLDAANL